jgi:hypothetical protein
MANIVSARQPTTSDFGLIEAPFGTVIEAYLTWQNAIGSEPVRSEETSFGATLVALEPLSVEIRRAAFVPTDSGWTAYFASGLLGSDPFPVMSYLADVLQARAMRVCATAMQAKWPATIWEVYAPESLGGAPPLGYVRAISCANDGGRWTFESAGSPFPFEQLDRYSAKRKSERFDRQLLVDYLAHFSLRPFDDDFYIASVAQPSVVIEKRRRWPSPPKEYSLEDVQRGLPWTPVS